MIYQLYQARADLLCPARMLVRYAFGLSRQLDFGLYTPEPLRRLSAGLGVIAGAALTHRRAEFGIASVPLAGRQVGVTESPADDTPFATLLRFRKETDPAQPRVLLVAPMSGHFATLLRGTVSVMLPDHDLYITDWKNARDVPLSAGRFGFDEFIDHIIRFLEVLGPGSHVIAVCQPAAAVLAAVALMAEAGNPAQPRSMTLMAGPIDTRVNPTKVNHLAKSHSIEWFERRLIGSVPWRYPGAWRRVYPGFLQLAAFISMNLDRHVSAHVRQFRALLAGDAATVEAHRQFYDEYFAVMDLPGEFYLETVQRIFQAHDLPLGRLSWRGNLVRPDAIHRTALLTVEGERDDICAIGQTLAALELCSGISVARKRNHLQTSVGHYGVFSGKRWSQEIYPRVREMIQITN